VLAQTSTDRKRHCSSGREPLHGVTTQNSAFLRRTLTMVCRTQNRSEFWIQKKHIVSVAGSVSGFRWGEGDTYSRSVIEVSSFWVTQQSRCLPPSSLTTETDSVSEKICFLCIQNSERWIKFRNPMILTRIVINKNSLWWGGYGLHDQRIGGLFPIWVTGFYLLDGFRTILGGGLFNLLCDGYRCQSGRVVKLTTHLSSGSFLFSLLSAL
jgi:hypothetical protein